MEETHYSYVESEEPEENEEYASLAEVKEALSLLSAEDHQKLMLIAKFWWHRRGLQRLGIEPAEILSTTVVRTLEGKRHWRKRKDTLIKHLDEGMESISGHFLEKDTTEKQISSVIYKLSQSSIHKRGEEKFISHHSHVENQVVAHLQLEEVGKLFADDRMALKVLTLRGEGKDASEIRQELSIDTTGYDTITKRIRRIFVRYSVR